MKKKRRNKKLFTCTSLFYEREKEENLQVFHLSFPFFCSSTTPFHLTYLHLDIQFPPMWFPKIFALILLFRLHTSTLRHVSCRILTFSSPPARITLLEQFNIIHKSYHTIHIFWFIHVEQTFPLHMKIREICVWGKGK